MNWKPVILTIYINKVMFNKMMKKHMYMLSNFIENAHIIIKIIRSLRLSTYYVHIALKKTNSIQCTHTSTQYRFPNRILVSIFVLRSLSS